MKIITTEYIKSLNPCSDRVDNWLEHYPNFEGTLKEFLDLDKITHKDKLWIYFKSIDKDNISLVAADFAEEVLHLYEEKYPNDLRPRKAIEVARNKTPYAVSYAAYHAAYAGNEAAGVDAAYAAYAAADAAYAAYADDAAYAAGAAYDADAAYAAAGLDSIDNIQTKQILVMKKWIK